MTKSELIESIARSQKHLPAKDVELAVKHILELMSEALRHRGPDDEGAYFDGLAGLANRRLSIIDTVTGHQPMSNETGSLQVVFNGEIYVVGRYTENLVAYPSSGNPYWDRWIHHSRSSGNNTKEALFILC